MADTGAPTGKDGEATEGLVKALSRTASKLAEEGEDEGLMVDNEEPPDEYYSYDSDEYDSDDSELHELREMKKRRQQKQAAASGSGANDITVDSIPLEKVVWMYEARRVRRNRGGLAGAGCNGTQPEPF